MGKLVNGVWHNVWYDTKASKGEFRRAQSQFRNWITVDGSAGPTGCSGFKAETGRYHLYISLACPWAHRTLIFRRLKKLEELIGLSIVHPDMLKTAGNLKSREKVRAMRSTDLIFCIRYTPVLTLNIRVVLRCRYYGI